MSGHIRTAQIDTNLTMQVLFGRLGIGAMRRFDKRAGTA